MRMPALAGWLKRSYCRKASASVTLAGVAVAVVWAWSTALAASATTVRVSVSSSGAQANAAVWLSGVSDHGRYVLMTSKATTLVAGDRTRNFDAFMRDAKTNTTVRVSVSSTGRRANRASTANAMSPNGRFVVFTSAATNLSVANDTNGVADVFVRDRQVGHTRRVSIPPNGGQFARWSMGIAVSGNGRYVMFTVGPPRRGFLSTYLRDRARKHTVRLGRRWTHDDVQGLGMSANGRMVAYSLIGTHDTILIHDRATGQTINLHRQPACCSPGGLAFTPDGAKAAFTADRPHANLIGAVEVWQRGGPITAITHGNTGLDLTYAPGITDDGNLVSFVSTLGTLVPGDSNNEADMFIHNLTTNTTRRVDLTTAGTQITRGIEGGHNFGSGLGGAISGDGRWAAFTSSGSGIVPADTNGKGDVFLRGPLH
jgi:hypothetical protein